MDPIPRGMRIPRVVVALAGVAVLVAGLAAVPAAAVPVDECPEQEIMPVSDIEPGMTATGLTVSKGTEPEPFDVEVLGVLPDAILPGRDMIIVEVSSPAIEKAGGIWYGMSGSPVYFEDKLMGAVAWGLSWGPSAIGGLTAAEDMVKVLKHPSPSAAAASSSSKLGMNQKVRMPQRMRERIARHAGVSSTEVSGTFTHLKTPLSVSGLSARALNRLRKAVAREGLPLVPHAGSSASAGVASAAEPIEPGDSFAGALSYGDITQAGIGTATMVCEGKVLAFGHPFFWTGKSFMGANHARAITVVDDKIFGPYKLAVVGEGIGIVDQDRFAAIRGDLERLPNLIPLTTSTTAGNTGLSRDGRTDVVLSDFVPFTTFAQIFTNIDTTFDQISGGSSTLSWTITGTRASGEPWQLTRSNLYADTFDISWGSSFEILGELFALQGNRFEKIEFTGVDVDATVDEAVRQYTLKKVLVSVNGGSFKQARRINVRRGAAVRLRAVLAPSGSTTERVLTFRMRIPRTKGPRFGMIEIGRGGGPGLDFECFFFGDECESQSSVGSLDELISSFENEPHNNDLLARLSMGSRNRVVTQRMKVLDQVVAGSKRIRVIVVR